MADKIIECTREYIVTDTTFSKCDKCRALYAKAFDITPVVKTHSFDNIVLCPNCLKKCHIQYNVDIQEVIKAGSVDEWSKK